MPVPKTNTKIGNYSDFELVNWPLRERHKRRYRNKKRVSQSAITSSIQSESIAVSIEEEFKGAPAPNFEQQPYQQSMSIIIDLKLGANQSLSEDTSNNSCTQSHSQSTWPVSSTLTQRSLTHSTDIRCPELSPRWRAKEMA